MVMSVINSRVARIQQYERDRDEVKTGDLFMYRGKGFISAMTCWIGKSEYSHAAIAAWISLNNRRRLIALEAVGGGLRVYPFSEQIRKYHGGIDLYKINDLKYDGDKAADWMWERIGTPYSNWQLLRFFRNILVGRLTGRDILTYDVNNARLVCSEAAANAINYGLGQESAKVYSPGELADWSMTTKTLVFK